MHLDQFIFYTKPLHGQVISASALTGYCCHLSGSEMYVFLTSSTSHGKKFTFCGDYYAMNPPQKEMWKRSFSHLNDAFCHQKYSRKNTVSVVMFTVFLAFSKFQFFMLVLVCHLDQWGNKSTKLFHHLSSSIVKFHLHYMMRVDSANNNSQKNLQQLNHHPTLNKLKKMHLPTNSSLSSTEEPRYILVRPIVPILRITSNQIISIHQVLGF